MKHMIFALFGSLEQAEAALREVAQDADCQGCFRVRVRCRQILGANVDLGESAAPAGSRYGLVTGTIFGAALSALLAGPLGLAGGATLWAALIGGVGGGVLGFLYGALQGSTIPDPHLSQLALHCREGRVLVSVESTNAKAHRRIAAILRARGTPAACRCPI